MPRPMISNLTKQIRALRSLCAGEFVASVTFIGCLAMFSYRDIIIIDYAVIYPFISLLLVLLQGSYYWYYKLRCIKGKNPNRGIFKKTYQTFRMLDIVMFAGYPIGLLVGFIFDDIGLLRAESFAGIFLFAFGILEYINYFYIRLSYSKYEDIVALLRLKNIRKSSLNKELAK